MEKTPFHKIPNKTRVRLKLKPEYEKSGYYTDVIFIDGYFYPYDVENADPEFYLGDVAYFCEGYSVIRQKKT